MAVPYAPSVPNVSAGAMSLRFFLVAATLFTFAGISPSLLVFLGANYVLPGGNPLEKIHPGTYVAVLSLSILALTGALPSIRKSVMVESTGAFWLLCGSFALAIFVTLLKTVSFTSIIDTFIACVMMFVLISLIGFSQKIILGRMLDVFILFNSLLGLYEAGTNWRLVPLSYASLVLGQIIYPYEWRASALLGHPLANAYVTGSYILALVITNRIPNMAVRLALIGVNTLALFAFGSRGAAAFLGVFFIGYIFFYSAQALAVGKLRRDVGAYIVATVPAILVATPLILGSGLADRFIDRFVYDRGSAQTRSQALDMILSYSFSDLLFGPSELATAQMAARFGTEAGIENFWLNFLLRYGVLGCLVFFPALFLFCRSICERSPKNSWLILVYFFMCCTTSVSLASKTMIFTLVMAICMTSVDRVPLALGGPKRRIGSRTSAQRFGAAPRIGLPSEGLRRPATSKSGLGKQ